MRSARPSLTEGSIVRVLFALSFPIVLSNLLQTAYQFTDTYWVGKVGAAAVASVSLSFPIIFLLISMGGGLAIAGTILVAQNKGKGDTAQVNHVATQTIIMVAIIALPLALLGYGVSEPILRLMGAPPDVLPSATSYMRISFIGLPMMFGFFVFQSLMQGVGSAKLPMYIVLSTVILNFLLDPLFIMGYGPVPAYGVTGAAIATVGTQTVATVIGLLFLLSGRYGIHFQWHDFTPDFPLLWQMVRLGFPASVEQSMRALGMAVMVFLVASFGTVVMASYGIGGRIFSFVIIPAMGFSMATSALVGQNIGAGKRERAVQTARMSATISFLLLSVLGIAFFLFARPSIAFFIPDDQEVIEMGSRFLRIIALTFGFMGLQQVLYGALRGAGNTVASMVLSLVSLWVIQFPLAYILSKHTSLHEAGIWWGFAATNVLSAVITLAYLPYSGWKKAKPLTGESEMKEQVFETAAADEATVL
ncbi:MAG: MATE family efflux transporter [Candidatus Peribacteraceae bacterium]|nr:MATE family efflux transporter [Candidatus Peribacteraceae bacterium]